MKPEERYDALDSGKIPPGTYFDGYEGNYVCLDYGQKICLDGDFTVDELSFFIDCMTRLDNS